MISLRPRQQEFVNKSIESLIEHGNTLSIAPTGAGKTICLSAVIGELAKQKIDFKACVLAHRDELTNQNADKFCKVNPDISTSLYNAAIKSWDGQVTFAMVQTLSKPLNLQTVPFLDLIVIDEAHHATTQSYTDILEQAKKINSKIKIFGVTATPNRGDKTSLGRIFDNCGDQIRIEELLNSGHLVKPRTFVVSLGNTQEKLKALRTKSRSDYNDQDVADILNTVPLNSEVVKHWRAKAEGRKTVVFCSTIQHAKDVTNAFNAEGIRAALVTGECSAEQRERVLSAVVSGEVQIIVNVSVLTEGWDFPPISCVILLRQSSYKSTLMQMIGRGLRVVDSTIYPDINKSDCIVLDFGISSILHGNLEQSVDLVSKDDGHRLCNACKRKIPNKIAECPLCGYNPDSISKTEAWAKAAVANAPTVIKNFTMSEIDMLKKSDFFWTNIEKFMVAAGFYYWCCIVKVKGFWLAVTGGTKKAKDAGYGLKTEFISKSANKEQTIKAADDFLHSVEKEDVARKLASWRYLTASEQQQKWLPDEYKNALNKGDAANYITFRFDIKPKLREIGIRITQ